MASSPGTNTASPYYLDPDDAQKLADKLLTDSLAAIGRGDYPFFSKSWLRQLEDRDRRHPLIDPDTDPDPPDYKAMTYRLLRCTAMDPRSRACIRYTLNDLTPHQIADRMNISETTIRRTLTKAIANLAEAATGNDIYSQHHQILQVMHDDQHRRPPDKLCPTKCPQPCNDTGECPFRWYLHV